MKNFLFLPLFLGIAANVSAQLNLKQTCRIGQYVVSVEPGGETTSRVFLKM